ncbi:uncharacterized protein LOC116306422 isoform X2 [Actinia tenebrosa]|uniref:Uncharacterized protein LOC116306422 isoform X2 n=1 Tax=Actinia tenebrosa TaxID=6105 RepID=A0A6P8J466_ACTTE|nr:uncharacterized protein LOC116306422 isoform X2 [Actinia tenebrosa]
MPSITVILMKSTSILVLSFLVVAVLVASTFAQRRHRHRLCGDQLNRMHKLICKPHTGLPGRQRRGAEGVQVQDANAFYQPKNRRDLHEECCKEACSLHEIYEHWIGF